MTHQSLIEAVRARRSAPDFGCDQHVRGHLQGGGSRRPRIAPVSHAVRKAVQLVRERFQDSFGVWWCGDMITAAKLTKTRRARRLGLRP